MEEKELRHMEKPILLCNNILMSTRSYILKTYLRHNILKTYREMKRFLLCSADQQRFKERERERERQRDNPRENQREIQREIQRERERKRG